MNGIFNIPFPVNEPTLQYALLFDMLAKRMSNQR
jgi:hypothetical protein